MSLRRVFSIAALALALGAGSMFANTISYTTPIPTINMPLANESVLVQGFNMPGFTLTGVELTYSFNGSVGEFLTNTSGSPQPFTAATASTALFLTGPGALNISLGTESDGPQSGTASTTNPDVLPANPFSIGPTNDIVSDLSDFLTSSTVQFNFNDTGESATVTSNAPSLTLAGGFVGSAGGSLEVTYTYQTTNVTPEPATMALLGGGLLGLGLVGKKRFKKN